MLEKTVTDHPDHAPALASLGVLSMQASRNAEASELLERSVKLDPGNAETHYQLSLVYSRLGLQDKAQIQMAEFQRLRAAADKAKLSAITSGDPQAEN